MTHLKDEPFVVVLDRIDPKQPPLSWNSVPGAQSRVGTLNAELS